MKAKSLLGVLIFVVSLFSVASSITVAQRFTIIIPSPDEIMDITAGDSHTCVRQFDGDVYCWGRNDRGQAGTWTSAVVNAPIKVATGAIQLEAGAGHTCILNSARNALCWGDNTYGQLGIANGSYGYQSSPLPVAGGLVFSTISAGKYSTCGNATTGLFCWGNIMNNGTGIPTPVQILGPNGYSNVTVGHRHMCAVYAVGSWREVNCFGNNSFGQMAIDKSFSNLPFMLGSNFGSSVSRVSTQVNFTCADQMSGIVQCAGENIFGQLGNGVVGGDNFMPQTVGNGMGLRGVSTGSGHACAIDPSSRAHCWGSGSRGQLGNNASAFTPQGYIFASPQPVLGGLSFRAIASGGQHTCAVTTDNRVFCWGDNGFGQLGLFYNSGFQTSPTWNAM